MSGNAGTMYAGAEPAERESIAGKYLTFCLGSEVYGLQILKVQEIIGIMKVTRVPKTPEFVRGVINLRGKVIPVVDLRLKFRLEKKDDTERTCVIVVQTTTGRVETTIGIIVDEVSEVLDIEESRIEPPPSFGSSVDTDFILGMGKVLERVVMLLDIDKVLSAGEVTLIDQVSKEY